MDTVERNQKRTNTRSESNHNRLDNDYSDISTAKKVAARLTSGFKWISTINPKTLKGLIHGYITAVLPLAPAMTSGYETCYRYRHCASTCLFHQGRGRFPQVEASRIKKTRKYAKDPHLATEQIDAELKLFAVRAKEYDFIPCVRLNCFSDIPWEERHIPALNGTIIDNNPHIQFYDYTKIPWGERSAWENMPTNYYLIYSYDGTEEDIPNCLKILKQGHNIHMVYSKPNYKKFLKELSESSFLECFHQWLYPMINSEISDNRFLDPSPVICIGCEKGYSNIAI